MSDCTVVRCDDIYTVVSGLSDDNIICDFIPVLEITKSDVSKMVITTWSQRCSFVWGNPA